MTSAERTEPVHPTMILLAWAAATLALTWLFPVEFVSESWARPLELSVLLPGVLIWAWGAWELWRNGVRIDHDEPSSALVTSGPFRFSRNPLYLGLGLVMVGIGVGYESLWAILLVGPAALAVHRLTVLGEEAELERQFGESYRRYRGRVRRWI